MRPALILIGPPGSGKSTVGAAVAERLQLDFHDTDTAIELAHNRTIADIFITDGEVAFRAIERAEVARAMREQIGVIALGGGAPLDRRTQAELREHHVVFLDVGIADAAGRVGFDRSRPLLAVNPRAQWTTLMRDRRPIYEGSSRVRVDTAGRGILDVVAEVADTVRR